MDNTSDDSKKIRLFPWLIFLGIIAVYIGYWYAICISGWFPGLNKGQFGDMFGAVNALFAGLAFAGVIWAIILQKEELGLQRKELTETRAEIHEQSEQLKSQAQTLQKQNFESSFFQLLGFYNEIVNSVQGHTGQYPGREYFAHLLSALRRKYRKKVEECECNSSEKEILKATYEKFFTVFYPNVGYYFRYLYNVIKFVDQSDFLFVDQSEPLKVLKEKKFYTDLIRAQLSSNELGLLFFYCLSDQEVEFKDLVEKFALLEYMPSKEFICEGEIFEELTRAEYRKLYVKSAYGESGHMDDQ